jgi:hypothetical protein
VDHGSGLRVHPRPRPVPGGLTSEFRAFVEQEFERSAKGGSGASEVATEVQARKSAFASADTKDKINEAAEQRLDCPPQLEWLWGVFSELNASRNYSEVGPASISHHDLICWQYINQTRLTIWESDLLLDADLRYRVHQSKQREKELKKAKK